MGLDATRAAACAFAGRALPRRNPVAVARSGIVLVPEGRGIFGPMTVAENLQLGAYMIGGRGQNSSAGASACCRCFRGLKERLAQVAGSLSGGEQQMLAVGRALMADPNS